MTKLEELEQLKEQHKEYKQLYSNYVFVCGANMRLKNTIAQLKIRLERLELDKRKK